MNAIPALEEFNSRIAFHAPKEARDAVYRLREDADSYERFHRTFAWPWAAFTGGLILIAIFGGYLVAWLAAFACAVVLACQCHAAVDHTDIIARCDDILKATAPQHA